MDYNNMFNKTKISGSILLLHKIEMGFSHSTMTANRYRKNDRIIW